MKRSERPLIRADSVAQICADQRTEGRVDRRLIPDLTPGFVRGPLTG